jgi:hypothetical protein
MPAGPGIDRARPMFSTIIILTWNDELADRFIVAMDIPAICIECRHFAQ